MAHHKNTASALAREPDARYLQPAPIAGTLVDSGVLIDRHKLQQMLGEAAQLAQQRLGGAARVMSRVMDLTPRLGRLETPR